MAKVKRGKDHPGIPEGYSSYTTPKLAREGKYVRRKMEGFQDTKHEFSQRSKRHKEAFKRATLLYNNLRPCEKEGLKDLWRHVGDVSPLQEYEKWVLSFKNQFIGAMLKGTKEEIYPISRPLCFCFKVADRRGELKTNKEISIYSEKLKSIIYDCVTNEDGDVKTSSLYQFFEPYKIIYEGTESEEYTAKEIHDMNYFYVPEEYKIVAGPSVFENLRIAYFNQPAGLDIYPTSEKEWVWEEGTDKVQTTTEAGWQDNYVPVRCYTLNNFLAVENTPDSKNRVIHVFFEKEGDYYKFKDSSVLFDFSEGDPEGDPEYCYIHGVYNTTKSLGIRYGKTPNLRDDDKFYLTAPMWGIVKDEIEIAGIHPEDPWANLSKVIKEENGMWKIRIYGQPRVWRYPSICELYGYTYDYCVENGIYWFAAAQIMKIEEYIPIAESKIIAGSFSSKGEYILLLEDKSIYYTGIFIDDMEIIEWENGPSISEIEAITGPFPSFIAEGGQLY